MAYWSVEENEIKSLPKDRIDRAVFDLIESEAVTCGIPSSKVILVEEEKKDGGVDVHIEDHKETKKSDWYVKPKSIWQIKTEKFSTVDEFIKSLIKEIDEKGKFIESLTAKGYEDYIIVWSHNPAGQSIDKIESDLDSFFKSKKWKLKSHILTANQIANWFDYYQSLCEKHFGRAIGRLQSFDTAYKTQVNSGIPFQMDEAREILLNHIRENCQQLNDQKHIRVEGVTGVGKTRVVLEAIKDSPVAKFCLYASDPSQIPEDYLSHLERAPKKPSDIFLVIDECDDETARIFSNRLNALGIPYLLITLNRKSDRKLADTAYNLLEQNRIYLLPLGENMVQTIVKLVVPNAPENLINAVVHLSGGFVKLAVFLAEESFKRPSSTEVLELINQPTPQNALRVLVEDEGKRNLLRYLALFTELGWDDEVKGDKETVIGWAGMDSQTSQRFHDICVEMQDRGLVIKRGRYRYVTPDLFAIWLAHDFYRSSDTSKVLKLVESLTSSNSKSALLERVADLGIYPDTQPLIEGLLAGIKDIKDINSDEAGQLVSLILEANPELSKKKVLELVTKSSKQELLNFKSGRQYLVWALEKLAWLPQSFEEALESLFYLAATENSPYANNATAAIKTLYQTVLSGTAVPLKVRLDRLEIYLKHHDPSIRKIAAKAAGSVFNDYQTRASHGEKQRGRTIPPEYRPTNVEIKESLERSLIILKILSKDKNEEVASEAKKIIFDLGRECVRFNMFDQYLSVASEIYKLDQDTGREVRESLEIISEYENKILTPEQMKEMNTLLTLVNSANFHSKLERWAGKPTHEGYRLQQENPDLIKAEREKIARELLNDLKLFDQELTWMLSDDALDIWHVVFLIGQQDTKKEILQRLLKIKDSSKGAFLISGYVSGWTSKDKAKAVAFLEEKIRDQSLQPSALFECIWRNDYIDQEWSINTSINLVENQNLEPWYLGAFRWVRWLPKVNLPLFKKLLKTCMGNKDTEKETSAAIDLLHDRLKDNPNEKEELSELALLLLTRVNAVVNTNQMTEWVWNEIAEVYRDKYPLEIAEAILKAHKEKKKLVFSGDYAAKMLHTIALQNQNEVWEIVGKYLLGKDEFSTTLRISLERWFAGGLDHEMLVKWAGVNEAEGGPLLIADLSPVRGVSFQESLVRKLLIKYPQIKDLKSIVFGNFLSGSFSGPMSDHIKDQLKEVEGWKKDENSVIKKFAQDLIDYLEKQLKKEIAIEEERGW